MKRGARFILYALMMALALCIVACSGGGSNGPRETEGFTPRLDPETECSITVAGHYNNFEALEAEFNRFSEYYPNVKLTYVFMDGYSKSGSRILSTALAGSEAPDIFFTYPWMGGWEDGPEILAASEDLSDPALGLDLSCIRSNLLKTENGQLLSVPIYTTTYGMMVNEDIFLKEGLKVPTTYEELLSTCEALKAAGYSDPILACSKGSGDLLYPLFYPYFCGQIAGDEKALGELNSMDPRAGEYMRGALDLVTDFMSRGYLNLENCDALKDNYEAVILRFFEGDVPMMLATGNTVSGTEKRESKSEAFTENPFTYSLHPVPSTAEGGYFVNTISIGFGVNKNSRNLDMANEFMRFLVSTEELNRMAKAKRMVTPCADMSLDSVYAPFQALDESHFINVSELGLSDEASSQVTKAGYNVALGNMTVDEAVGSFGSIK
ncbi:MAG: carbohydrate ABC transporter substrate-binding protein [Oscillospiraceae bacterium]|nr:carbohydrate ABC transporter substrate-binding protein [Oscillospiraceae bacterium]